MKAILQNGDPLLREISQPVPPEMFGTPELTQMVKDMTEALDAEKDGVALAGPQIGLNYRIFIARYDRLLPDTAERKELPAQLGVFINPQFIRSSRRRVEMDEGCLSVRAIYGKTYRNERATLRAQDASGKWFERGGGGILAQIFQHEIDHLDGVLFVDHAMDLIEVRRRGSGDTKTVEEVPVEAEDIIMDEPVTVDEEEFYV